MTRIRHLNMTAYVAISINNNTNGITLKAFKKIINDYVNKYYPHSLKGKICVYNKRHNNNLIYSDAFGGMYRNFAIRAIFASNCYDYEMIDVDDERYSKQQDDFADLINYIIDKYCVYGRTIISFSEETHKTYKTLSTKFL